MLILDAREALAGTKAGDLLKIIEDILPILGRIPRTTLSAAQRPAMASRLYDEVMVFVDETARGVGSDPPAFRDLDADPQALSDRQERAWAAMVLRDLFLRFARLCGDLYLIDQHDCAEEARDLVTESRRSRRSPMHARRVHALGPAAEILDRRTGKGKPAKSKPRKK